MSDGFVELTDRTGSRYDAYVATPAKPNGGSVVVLQEIFGVNENIRRISDELAARGFTAIAPDLFWRQARRIELDPRQESDRARAFSLMKGLESPSAVGDALTAASYLTNRPESNGKVGCVGFCLGGKLAFLLSAEPGVSCAVSYYGTGIHEELAQVPRVHASTLLHIAGTDHLCPPPSQSAILQAIEEQPRIHAIVHPGVGHAFARSGGATYDEQAASRANAATWELLTRELAS